MPTYEYQCDTCETVFDVFQSIKASPLRKADCPACEKTRSVRRLISTGGAVLFKGSGFYQTDYRSERYKEASKAEAKQASPASDATGDAAAPKPEAPKPAVEKSPQAPAKKPGKKSKSD